MNVLISIDMEGIAGIASLNQVVPGRPDYPIARALMTKEANAVAAGAFDAGATTVLVNDSHGPMDNLIGDDLDPRIEYFVGSPKPLSMMQGLDEHTDVALLIGYHAGPDVQTAVLMHSFSGIAFADLRLNDSPLTELELNALLAAQYNVPIGLVTGDDATCRLANKALPGVPTVQVKTAIGRTAARSLSPTAARAALRDGARAAVAAAAEGRFSPVIIPEVLILEAELRPHGAAEVAARAPGTERHGPRTIRRAVRDPQEALDVLHVWAELTAQYLASHS